VKSRKYIGIKSMLDYLKDCLNFYFSKGLKLTELKLNFLKKYSPLQVKNKSKKTRGIRERQRKERKRKKIDYQSHTEDQTTICATLRGSPR